jgi:hypothetical protein
VEAREVGIQADDGVWLAGTLTAPGAEGRAPAALLLNSSGPLDRDATAHSSESRSIRTWWSACPSGSRRSLRDAPPKTGVAV